MPLNGAIRRIINHRIIAKHKEEAISMKVYFKEYHILWNEILALCKEDKPSRDKKLKDLYKALNTLCNKLDIEYDINCGGCCYVTYCIAHHLYKHNIPYKSYFIFM